MPAIPPREFFMFILLISNHTVFLVQLGATFQKAEIALAACTKKLTARVNKFQIKLETV